MKTAVLSEAAIAHMIAADLPHWRFQEGALVRNYRTHGWKGTLMVVGAIGHLAEAAWHHPELIITYSMIEVRLNTHDVGGVSMRDIELARKIEDMVAWQPAREHGALEGTPDGQSAYLRYDD